MTKYSWLTLLLVLCIPSQALAAVMAECEKHIAEHRNHKQHIETVTPDCHGVIVSSHTSVSDTGSIIDFVDKIDNTAPCFHCSGTCQNFKLLALIPAPQKILASDSLEFTRLTRPAGTGFHAIPLRPPCLPA